MEKVLSISGSTFLIGDFLTLQWDENISFGNLRAMVLENNSGDHITVSIVGSGITLKQMKKEGLELTVIFLKNFGDFIKNGSKCKIRGICGGKISFSHEIKDASFENELGVTANFEIPKHELLLITFCLQKKK